MLWPVFWLTEEIRPFAVKLSMGTLFATPFLTLFKRTRFPAQILCFLSALILISISYSNGKSYHAGLSWIIFLPVFLSLKPFVGRFNAAHLAFFTFSTAYINSGIWKLRSLLPYLSETGDFSVLLNTLQEHIASSAVERVQPPTWLGQLVIDHLWLSGLLWISAIFIEISPILIPFFKRQTWLFALFLFLFHIGVYWTLRIYFFPSMGLLLVLSIYFFLQSREEDFDSMDPS